MTEHWGPFSAVTQTSSSHDTFASLGRSWHHCILCLQEKRNYRDTFHPYKISGTPGTYFVYNVFLQLLFPQPVACNQHLKQSTSHEAEWVSKVSSIQLCTDHSPWSSRRILEALCWNISQLPITTNYFPMHLGQQSWIITSSAHCQSTMQYQGLSEHLQGAPRCNSFPRKLSNGAGKRVF